MENIANVVGPSKAVLAGRLRQAREEFLDVEDSESLARRLGLPLRTWLNYESGVTIPGEILLRFVACTGVDLAWLIDGEGQPFGDPSRRQKAPGEKRKLT